MLAFAFLSAFFQVSDVDVGYHLRTGAHILAGHGIPAVNTFSSSVPEETWLLQQWLGATIYYLVYAGAGLYGLTIFKALLATFIMFLSWCHARRVAGRASLAPFWIVTAWILMARVRFFERPDLMSAAFFAGVYFLDERFRDQRRWQWVALPLLLAFWANVHSGVIYGVVLLTVLAGVEWMEWLGPKWTGWVQRGESRVPGWSGPSGECPVDLPATPESRCAAEAFPARLWVRPVSLLLSAVAIAVSLELINPNGFQVVLVPITQFTSAFWRSVILEYFPPTWAHAKVFYTTLAAMVVLQALTWRQRNWRLLLPAIAFAYLAVQTQRSVLFYALATAPYAAHLLRCVMPARERGSLRRPTETPASATRSVAWPVLAGAWLNRPRALRWSQSLLSVTWAALIGFVLLPDRTFRFGVGYYAPYYPMEIFRFIDQQVPPQNIFNEMSYGGPMLWWLYPRFKPFIDGRGDAYTEHFWQTKYLPVMHGEPGWRDIFRDYDLHAVLLPMREPGAIPKLGRILFADPAWALVAYNDDALLFLERTPTNAPLIARHAYQAIWPGDWSLAALESTATRDQAAKEVARAAELAPESVFVRTAAARLCMATEQYSEAAKILEGLTQVPGASENHWRDYGYALYCTHRYPEAGRVFTRMIRKRMLPGFAAYMNHHIALGDYDMSAARDWLAQALTFEPANPTYLAARSKLESFAYRRPGGAAR